MEIELRVGYEGNGTHLSTHRTLAAAFHAVGAEEKRFRRRDPPGRITAQVRIFVDGEEKTTEWIGDGYSEVMAWQDALDREAGVWIAPPKH